MRNLYTTSFIASGKHIAFKIGGTKRQYQRDMFRIKQSGIKCEVMRVYGTKFFDCFVPVESMKKMFELGFSISGTNQKFIKSSIEGAISAGRHLSGIHVLVKYDEKTGIVYDENMEILCTPE